MDKRFARVVETEKRVDPRRIHPMLVVADLERGSLASLDRYLAQEGGIPDRRVSIALRKLISGSCKRSDFRVIVMNHPHHEKNSGGRPEGVQMAAMARKAEIAAFFEESLIQEGKVWRANEITRDKFNCSKSTVERAVKEARELYQEKRKHQDIQEVRQLSLDNARKKNDL